MANRSARPPGRQHPSVLTATVTFCVGLVVVRLVASTWMPTLYAAGPLGDVLYQLQLLVAMSTLIYLVLRRGEGDFRALFIVAFTMFVGSECMTLLAHSLGIFVLSGLALMFNMNMLFFSCFALSAAIADGSSRDPYEKALTGATVGFLSMGALRVLLQAKDPVGEESKIILYLLVALAVYVTALLLRAESRELRERAELSRIPEKELSRDISSIISLNKDAEP